MSEIPAPPEIEKEAEDASSSEFPKPETEKNYDIQKLFEGFRNSEEYQTGLKERSSKLEIKGDFGEDEKETLLVAGFEGDKVSVQGREYDFQNGEHDAYKGAFMHYVDGYFHENGEWPLYFSPDIQGSEISDVYGNYKEKAKVVWANVRRGVDALELRNLDKQRSDAHDQLANLLYSAGKVENLLQGKLVARLWLVADKVESPAGITYMDRARTLREFEYWKQMQKM